MDLFLNGKVIIVTGGAKGIGLAIAQLLSSEGATPVIIDKDETATQSALAAISRAQGVVCDLTKPVDCKKAIDECVRRFGKIDGVVNNAGVNDNIALETGSYEQFVESLHKNLIHYFLIVKHALPLLKESKGAIVNISSKVAETGQGKTSAYAAANGGRNALTREWAVALAPHEIRVNAVIVAECFTPLYESWLNTFPDRDAKLNSIVSKIPLGKRMTTTEEIANAVCFLLSSRSSHTTGQLIHVDGGYTHLDRSIT